MRERTISYDNLFNEIVSIDNSAAMMLDSIKTHLTGTEPKTAVYYSDQMLQKRIIGEIDGVVNEIPNASTCTITTPREIETVSRVIYLTVRESLMTDSNRDMYTRAAELGIPFCAIVLSTKTLDSDSKTRARAMFENQRANSKLTLLFSDRSGIAETLKDALRRTPKISRAQIVRTLFAEVNKHLLHSRQEKEKSIAENENVVREYKSKLSFAHGIEKSFFDKIAIATHQLKTGTHSPQIDNLPEVFWLKLLEEMGKISKQKQTDEDIRETNHTEESSRSEVDLVSLLSQPLREGVLRSSEWRESEISQIVTSELLSCQKRIQDTFDVSLTASDQLGNINSLFSKIDRMFTTEAERSIHAILTLEKLASIPGVGAVIRTVFATIMASETPAGGKLAKLLSRIAAIAPAVIDYLRVIVLDMVRGYIQNCRENIDNEVEVFLGKIQDQLTKYTEIAYAQIKERSKTNERSLQKIRIQYEEVQGSIDAFLNDLDVEERKQ